MNVSPSKEFHAPHAVTFGRYRIIKKISSGGMGEIFLASLEREEGFTKQLVIKKLLPSLSQNPAFVAMFNNEARLAAQLSHTNIVQIFDFGRMEDIQFIAMEWVHGENLSDVITQAAATDRQIPVRVACQIILSVLRGLDYAHRKRDADGKPLELIHRDIAPRNVLVSYEGEVKLIDFGLAKATAAGDATEGGALKGSYCYMSPEQVGGRAMDARSDLFSAALVFFELLAGERLFPPEMGLRPLLEAIHHMDLSYWKRQGKNPWEGLPPGLVAILKKALATEPAARYQSAREFIEAIESFLREGNGAYPEISLSDYMHELFAEKIAVAEPAGNGGIERTHVSEDAQRALLAAAEAARLEEAAEGPPGTRAGRITHALFNVLAALIILSIIGGGGFLGYHFLIKPRLRARDFGSVRVVTDPPGSTVFFNGQPLSGASPIQIESVPLGLEHILRVEKPGYQPQEKKVFLEKGGDRLGLEQFSLVRAIGQVFLVSEPAGAEVILDEKELAGKTPLLLENIEVGTEHEMRLTKDGYRPEPIRFVIESPDKAERFTVQMIPLVASLTITSTPSGARVFMGGDKTGCKTPCETDKVEIGKEVSVRVKKSGWKGATGKIRIRKGSNSLSFKLEPLELEARLKAKGRISVQLDDKAVPANPLRFSVGDHLIRVQMLDAKEEFRLRLQVREHATRRNGLAVEANVDAKPWARVKAVRGAKEDKELTTPVSGLVFDKGSNRLQVSLSGEARIELSFDLP